MDPRYAAASVHLATVGVSNSVVIADIVRLTNVSIIIIIIIIITFRSYTVVTHLTLQSPNSSNLVISLIRYSLSAPSQQTSIKRTATIASAYYTLSCLNLKAII